MKEVKIEMLREVFNRIIKKLEYENVKSIVISEDLHNIIPTNKWSIYNNPQDVVMMSSLVDAIENLEQLAIDKNRVCTYVDFDRLASLLRIISEIRNP